MGANAEVRKIAEKQDFVLREFGGMNTAAYRTAIGDHEFAWLENVQPIGPGNAKVIPQASASLQTFPATCYYLGAYNIAGSDYIIGLCSDGSAYQVLATTPYTRTQIAAAATLTGSGGTSAQWKNDRVLILDTATGAGKGYSDWNGAALTNIDNTKNGTSIAVFAGRVWIGNNRTLTYTGTDYNTFAAPGGSSIMPDPTLHDRIRALEASNNFLYIIGNDSVNTISNVQIATGPVTTFSNTNIQASVGTTFDQSVFPYYRSLMYATRFGFYSLYGATPQKLKNDLDGIIPLIDFTKPVSGAQCLINNIICACWCFTYNDPVQGARQLLAVFFDNKWFVSSQGNASGTGSIKFITGTSLSGVPAVFGTDGTNLYQLFSSVSSNISWTMQTKLYNFGENVDDTSAFKFGMEVVSAGYPAALNVSIDSERTSQNYALATSTAITLIGTGPIVLIGISTIVLIPNGYLRFMGDVANTGKYIGATVVSTTPQVQVNNLMLQYKKGASW